VRFLVKEACRMGSWRAVALCAMVAVLLVVGPGCAGGPSGPKLPYEVARDLENGGKYAEAIEKYKANIAESPSSLLSPYAAFRIAKCYERIGAKDPTAEGKARAKEEALKAYDAVVEKYPESEAAKWAKVDKDYLEKNADKVLGKPVAPPKRPAPAPATK
jgi:tetratricopeptide (TPR) repeat protein